MEQQTTIIDLRGSGRSSSEEDFGVLADPSGRRRRGLQRAGRAVAGLFALWLAALALAGLGLLPGVGIPLASRTTADSAPPPLDVRGSVSGPISTTSATLTSCSSATLWRTAAAISSAFPASKPARAWRSTSWTITSRSSPSTPSSR